MSLKTCLKKSNISQEDKDFIRSELANGATEEQAIDALSKRINNEITAIVDRFEDEGGEVAYEDENNVIQDENAKELEKLGITESQKQINFEDWFDGSVVVDDSGNPITMYHGTGNIDDIFSRGFDPELTGQGMDQLGSGFYFTTSETEAGGYETSVTQNIQHDGTKLGGDTSAGTVKVYLSVKNPIIAEGANLNQSGVELTNEQVIEILKFSESSKHEEDSPFGDYFEEYWNGGTQDWMYESVSDNYSGSNLISLENDFFDGEATNFRKALNKILGYDGVIQKFDSGEQHVIAWFPEQIKSVDNIGTFDPADPNILKQSAYHGTPYKFDKFSLEAMGTGEGAQAYGWGLYFASDKSVAEWYRKQLTEDKIWIDGKSIGSAFDREKVEGLSNMTLTRLAAYKGSINDAKDRVMDNLSEAEKRNNSRAVDIYNNMLDELNNFDPARIKIGSDDGAIMQVDIPESDQLADWDNPIEKQPKDVLNKLKLLGNLSTDNIGGITKAMVNAFNKGDYSQVNIRQIMSSIGEGNYESKLAADKLNEVGVQGLRYLDGNSRSVDGDKYNYVIWDEKSITIEAVNGEILAAKEYHQEERAKFFVDERVIQLTESSDLSSFLHEGGHLFLEMQKQWSTKYGMTDNHQAILDWMDIKSFDDLTVELHEKWAETFEVYLREGKSPSLKLRRAFASFSRWLKRIYSTLVDGRLDRAKLDPEITGIFDRLLATEQEIQAASARPEYDQYFQSKEQAGMTDSQWAAYQKKVNRVKENAEMTIDEKILTEYMKRKTKAWNEEKKPLIADAKESLKKDRIYQVLGDLTSTRDDDGNTIQGRIDMDSLKELYPEGVPKKFTGKYAKNGVDINLIAEAYGYPSGKALAKEIENTPPLSEAADTMAETKMVNKYGDMMNDGTIEDQIRDAMLNEDQASLVMMELKANKSSPKAQSIDRQYLKAQAESMIAGMTFSEIKPDRFYRAMVKSAKESMVAEDPTDAKIQQLVNHYLYKEAMRVKIQMDKNRKYIGGVQKRTYSVKTVAQEYITQMKTLALAYDVRTVPEDRQARFTAVLNFYRGQQLADRSPLVDLVLIDPFLSKAYEEFVETGIEPNALVKTFDEMTANEILGVKEMLEHLRAVGGQVAGMNSDEAKRLKKIALKSILKKGGKDSSQQRRNVRQFDPLREWWNGIVNMMPSLVNMVKKLDGFDTGGIISELIFEPINSANDRKMELQKKLFDQMELALKEAPNVGLSRKDAEIFVPENEREDGREPKKWSSEEIFMVAVNWGTESSQEAIMAGYELTYQDVMSLISRLTKEQLTLANSVWALNESQWPDLQHAAKVMNGVAPPKLPPTPFMINGVQLTGGHMQLIYNTARTELQDEQLRGVKSSDITPKRAGSTFTRVGSGGKLVSLDIHNIAKSINEKVHYIAFAEVGRDLRSILNDPEIQDAIERKHGLGFYKAFIGSITSITSASPSQESEVGLAKASKYLRQSATMMHLMYSIRNVVQQPSAAVAVMKTVGPLAYVNMTGQMISNPKKFMAVIDEKSKFMENRAQVVNREVRESINRLTATSKIEKNWQSFKAYGFVMQTYVDSTVAYPAWMAAYNKSISEFGDEKKARIDADTTVAQSVGSGSDMHLGRVMQSNQNEFVKTLTVFGSWFNAYYQRLYESSQGGKSYVNTSFAMDALIVPMAIASLTQALVMDGMDNDEEWYQWMLDNYWRFMIGTIPVVREIGSLTNGFTPTQPINSMPSAVVRATKEVISYRKGNQTGLKTAVDIGKAVSTIAHAPGSGEVLRVLDYTDSYLEGKEKNFNPYQMLTEGPDKNVK